MENFLGNTKTSDHVILRDMYTHPGDLFSRDAIIRTHVLIIVTHDKRLKDKFKQFIDLDAS